MSSLVTNHLDSIAVVGMSGRYPGAKGIDQFWANLAEERESITFFTDEELLESGVDRALLDAPNYVKAKGVCEGTYEFDAPFFGYNPREAELIDPQQRIFLECAWEALEHAGYDPATYEGRIGLFGGEGATKQLFEMLKYPIVKRTFGNLAVVTSNDKDYLATRVGYKLNFRGPCITVQTACSTSLVAIVVACQNLLNYQCDMALAGGVTLSFEEREGYFYDEGGIVSPDGHCKTFDANGQGTIFSCGAGLVTLKRLEDAIQDKDTVFAVIRGFGLNNDGAMRIGFTAPGMEGQIGVSSDAIQMADIDASTIQYVECHGTATPVGDPIEVTALTKSFRKYTDKKNFCALGSVKTNIGHTDAAAGVAGFTKTVLALKHKVIPASLHFQTPNPQINFAESPFYVNAKTTEWKRGEHPRRAGVNSFGVGGTNAHVILEEAPELVDTPAGPNRSHQILVWSAKTAVALDAMTERLAVHLDTHAEVDLADAAYTLQTGRHLFAHRRSLVCKDAAEAVAILRGQSTTPMQIVHEEKQDRPVCFLFPGQGSQYAGMGRDLYETESVFRESVDRCAEILSAPLGLDIRELLFATGEDATQANEKLQQTAITQPALFTIEYSLAQLLRKWGITPSAMLGHSVGEYVAACVAGVFSLESALTLVVERGRLMQSMPSGAMVAILAPESDIAEFIAKEPATSIAAINSPLTCVASGPTEAIERLEAKLQSQGVSFRRLVTSHAFHSQMMDPILEHFRAVLGKVEFSAPKIPYLSNLTGDWASADLAASPDYWVNHLRQCVKFADGVGELLSDTDRVLIEVGPGRALSTLAAQHPAKSRERVILSTLPHPTEDSSNSAEFLAKALGKMWQQGVHIDWKSLHGQARRRVQLPTYPFQREQYRLALPTGREDVVKDLSQKKSDIAEWFHYPSWKRIAPAESNRSDESTSWILFTDGVGIEERVVESLRELGEAVVTVSPGPEFLEVGPDTFTIDPANPEHYDRFFRLVRSSGEVPGHVVHMWTVPHTDSDSERTTDQLLDRAFYSLVFIAQAISTHFPAQPMRIDVVSSDLHDVTGEGEVHPWKATALGPCKTIPHEFPHLKTRNIDIQVPKDEHKYGELTRALLFELSGSDEHSIVAYRGGHRWLQSFEPIRISGSSNEAPSLRENGVYLITGGMGGIGLVLARYLVENVSARVVLVGRSSLPHESQWETWIAKRGEQDSTSRRIRQLQQLAAAGGEVLALQADVADIDQVRGVFAAAEQRFGAVHGVIHSAGVAGDGIIELKTREMSSAVLAPKVAGTIALDAVIADRELDFFVLCSSLTSIFGDVGQVDYTAANAYLDAYAQSKSRTSKTRTVAINWDRWDEIGMAVDKMTGAAKARRQRPEPEYEPIEHPLFTGRSKTPEADIFVAYLSSEEHWIVGEHRLSGNPTLVGTAYLELARLAYAFSDDEATEISNVIFMYPLVIEDNHKREVQVVLKPQAESFSFQIRSSSDGISWQEHAMGNLRKLEKARSLEHPVEKIKDRCTAAIIMHDKPASFADKDSLVQLGNRWNNISLIRQGANEAIASLTLASSFVEDLKTYQVHPALMDCATAFAAQFAAKAGQNYLPFSYKSIKLYRPLREIVYSHARYQPVKDMDQEFMSFDISILDEKGGVLVEIEGYDMKRISKESFRANQNSGAAAKTAAVDPVDTSIPGSQDKLGDRILSVEGVEAFRRILETSRMPQLAVAAKDFSFYTQRKHSSGSAKQNEGTEANSLIGLHSRPDLATPYTAPRNELEQSIVEIWQMVLGIDKIGVNDGFVELGGHSLMAIQLAARVRDTFEVELSVATLYKTPTVAGLASAIIEALASQAGFDLMEQALDELEAESTSESRPS